MEKLKVCLVQVRCEKGDISRNLGAMEAAAAEAKANGAEIVCFPEMNISGYIDPARHPEAVLNLDGEEAGRVLEMSRRYGLLVIAGIVEGNGKEKPYITQFVADRGSFLGYYRKKTIKDQEVLWFSPGKPGEIFRYRGLPFGIAICADIDDGEIFAEYARKGARLVFECAAPGLYGEQATRNWESGYRWWRGECMTKLARYAGENAIRIAVATQAGRTSDEDFPGGGYLFAEDGNCVLESGGWNEGLLYAEIGM